MLQLHVTGLFYLDNNRKTHPWGVRACPPKDTKRRVPQHMGERERKSFASSFYMFFPSPRPVLYKLGQPGVCLFYLRSSLQSWYLPLFYFHRLFSPLSFSHHHSGLLFPISNYPTYIYIYICICTHMHTHTYFSHKHIHIHTYTHTHTHTHAHTL